MSEVGKSLEPNILSQFQTQTNHFYFSRSYKQRGLARVVILNDV